MGTQHFQRPWEHGDTPLLKNMNKRTCTQELVSTRLTFHNFNSQCRLRTDIAIGD
jgi:hypothetical protein